MPGRALDLEAYFERIGYPGKAVATLAALKELHWRHASTIPFENLDVLLGRPVDLAPAAIAAKLVAARRGGYCFEQNGLFLAVLRRLGFAVEAFAARVWWGRSDAALPPCTHMLLKVQLAEGDFLCDVGFGGLTPVSPLRWEMNLAQATTHETYRLMMLTQGPAAGEIALEASIEGGWQRLYSFRNLAVDLADFTLANWYVATHPASFFTQAMIVAMPFADGRHVLQDLKVTTRSLERNEAVRQLADAADLGALLHGTFGLDLGRPEIERLWERLAAPSHAALAK
jgi:N-hydroxyarylamine O-acetyltransferase